MLAGETVSLHRCVFKDCIAGGSGASVFMTGGALQLDDCSIWRCTSSEGGGIDCRGGSATLHRITIEECTASKEGGALFIKDAKVTVQSFAINRCRADVYGGAVKTLEAGRLTMSDGEIRDCTSQVELHRSTCSALRLFVKTSLSLTARCNPPARRPPTPPS